MTDLVTESTAGLLAAAACPRPLRPVRAAVVGLGRTGILHAAALSTIPDCSLVGVADSWSEARQNLRGLGYTAPGFGHVENLLSKTQPEALFVSTQHEDPVRIARLALEAGVAVMVDRPLARTRAEADELGQLAAEKGLPLACGHPLAYHPVFAQAQQVLASGVLGAARQVRSSMYLSRVFNAQQKREHAPAHSAGGVVSQAASDLLFLLVWYLGTPSTVRAASSQVYEDHEDELRAMMTLPDGAEIGFDSSWSVPGYPRAATVIELDGENGTLLASDDALELDLDAARGGFPAGHIRLGHDALTQAARFDLDGDAPYIQDSSFLAWVTGGEPPPTRAELALRVPRLVEALYISAREGGKATAVRA